MTRFAKIAVLALAATALATGIAGMMIKKLNRIWRW